MNNSPCRDYVPGFLVYEHTKVPIPGGGRHQEPMILIFCLQDTIFLSIPDVPVFHAPTSKHPVDLGGMFNALCWFCGGAGWLGVRDRHVRKVDGVLLAVDEYHWLPVTAAPRDGHLDAVVR